MARKNKYPAAPARAATPPEPAPAAPAFATPPGQGAPWHSGLYENPDAAGGPWQWRPNLNTDIAALLSKEKHRLLLSDAKYLIETFDVLAEAIQQKSEYVCQAGFAPHFAGTDHDWAAVARAALLDAHASCNVRGPLFPWDKSWQITSTTPDTMGGCFILLGETETGYPQLQFLEAHRIGSRASDGLVETGPYAGRRIQNGIIYDDLGAELAYRVLGPTEAEDRDIPATSMLHVAIPRWHSDGRPVPNVAYSLLSLYDVKAARGYQLTKQKVNSQIVLTEGTPDGKAPAALTFEQIQAQRTAAAAARAAGTTPPPAAGSAAAPIQQLLAGGTIRYFKFGGGDIKSHTDTTPGNGWLEFDRRVLEAAMNGIGWSLYMLDLSKFGGAATRGFQDQINTKIYARWLDLVPFVLRAELYLLAKLIARGDVPPHPEWFKWTYTPPADFTVDGGRANKADLDNVRAGVESIPALIGRFGRGPEEVLRAQARYLQQKAEIEKEFGLDPGALGNMAYPGWPGDQFGAAGTGQDTQPAPAPAPTKTP